MAANQYDLVIVGGGLAGCLLLQALQHRHPHLKYLLIEQSDHVGGNHNWSFHDADLSEACKSWFLPLISHSWNGYEVSFPDYSRTFQNRYHCLTSDDLSKHVQASSEKYLLLHESVTDIKKGDNCEITLSSGRKICTETVILAKGWDSKEQPTAWQKFVGMQIELNEPHGLDHVLLIDARVPQIDGFRFFYLLPWSETRLLIEDTYYSSHTVLKVERIEQEVLHYLEQKKWHIKKVESKSHGMLPLMMNRPRGQKNKDFPKIGAASGFFHPITGYTVPTLLRQIDAITEKSNLTMPSIMRALAQVEEDSKTRLRYYWLMNRLMFKAATPTERYRILSHFYKMPEPLIQRFYAGNTNLFDQLRMLAGKPPVPLKKAFQVFREGL